MLYGAGGRVGFFQGDIRLLPDDMKALQPTVFPVVPRLLNRVYDKVSHASLCPLSATGLILTSDDLPPAGSERRQNPFQEVAAELRRGQKVRRGEGRRHQEQQPVGQTHLQQSAGSPPPWGKGRRKGLAQSRPSPVGVSGGSSAGDGDGSGAHITDGPHLPASGSGLPGNKRSALFDLSHQPCLIWSELWGRRTTSLFGQRHQLIDLHVVIVTRSHRADPAAFDSQIFEGYGQTECAAACTFTMPGDATAGNEQKSSLV